MNVCVLKHLNEDGFSSSSSSSFFMFMKDTDQEHKITNINEHKDTKSCMSVFMTNLSFEDFFYLRAGALCYVNNNIRLVTDWEKVFNEVRSFLETKDCDYIEFTMKGYKEYNSSLKDGLIRLYSTHSKQWYHITQKAVTEIQYSLKDWLHRNVKSINSSNHLQRTREIPNTIDTRDLYGRPYQETYVLKQPETLRENINEETSSEFNVHAINAVHLTQHNVVRCTVHVPPHTTSCTYMATFVITEHNPRMHNFGGKYKDAEWHLQREKISIIENVLNMTYFSRKQHLSFHDRERFRPLAQSLIDDNDCNMYPCFSFNAMSNDVVLRKDRIGITPLTPITEQNGISSIDHNTLSWKVVEKTDIERVTIFCPMGENIAYHVCSIRIPIKTPDVLQEQKIVTHLRLQNTRYTVSLLRAYLNVDKTLLSPLHIMSSLWCSSICKFWNEHLVNEFLKKRDSLLKNHGACAIISFNNSQSNRQIPFQFQNKRQKDSTKKGTRVTTLTGGSVGGTEIRDSQNNIVFECLGYGKDVFGMKNNNTLFWISRHDRMVQEGESFSICNNSCRGHCKCTDIRTISKIQYYIRQDETKFLLQWDNLNHLFNEIICNDKVMWEGPSCSTWTSKKQLQPIFFHIDKNFSEKMLRKIPFDRYGCAVGGDKEKKLLRMMLVQAIIEGPDNSPKFEKISSEKVYKVNSRCFKKNDEDYVLEKNLLGTSNIAIEMEGRLRIDQIDCSSLCEKQKGRTIEFEKEKNKSFVVKKPHNFFLNKISTPVNIMGEEDAIPYHISFPNTVNAWEKDPELTQPFAFDREGMMDSHLQISSGVRLTSTNGVSIYPGRQSFHRSSLEDTFRHKRRMRSGRNRVEIPYEVIDPCGDPYSTYEKKPTCGIFWGPWSFSLSHNKVGGSKEDLKAMKQLFDKTYAHKINRPFGQTTFCFSKDFVQCCMNSKPLIELASCKLTLASPGVFTEYVTPEIGYSMNSVESSQNIVLPRPYEFFVKNEDVQERHVSFTPSVKTIIQKSKNSIREKKEKNVVETMEIEKQFPGVYPRIARSKMIRKLKDFEEKHLTIENICFREILDLQLGTIRKEKIAKLKKDAYLKLLQETVITTPSPIILNAEKHWKYGFSRPFKGHEREMLGMHATSLNQYQEDNIFLDLTENKWCYDENKWSILSSLYSTATQSNGYIQESVKILSSDDLLGKLLKKRKNNVSLFALSRMKIKKTGQFLSAPSVTKERVKKVILEKKIGLKKGKSFAYL